MRRRLALEATVLATVTLAAVAWVLQLWHADLSIPLRYPPLDDTKFYLMLVKGIIEHGSYLTNAALGAPFGQQLYDFPQGGDDLSLLLIRGLGFVSSNPSVVLNLFFLLTFPLAALSAHFALRRLGLGAGAAGVAAVLFALLPYHFFRGEPHLLLSAYYAVPLGVLLFLELLAPAPLFADRRRTLLTVGLCAAVGSANLYYAVFTLVLLVAAALVSLGLRRRRTLRDALGVIGLIVTVLAVNLSPTLIYRAQHGANPALARTAAADQASPEGFDLRLADLVLPVPGSRIAPLRRLTARYDAAVAPGYCDGCYASLGLVGTVGFGWLALGGLVALAGAGGWLASRRLARHAAVGVAVALAVGAVGGLSGLIEVLVTADVRAWNRISVVIAFLSLLAVALLLDGLARRLRQRRHGRALGALALSAVLGFGVLEQTTAAFVPDYRGAARQWHSDARFVAEIEARLPRGARVFQLPYVPFPEGYPDTPIGDSVAAYATKYEPVRGYLHSDTLRWSYGATKGRPADWAAQLADQPLALVEASATAAGFDGLWLDPAGFEQPRARQVLGAVEATLASAPLLSPDGDLAFFDLRPLRRRLIERFGADRIAALGVRVLHPAHPLHTGCAALGSVPIDPALAPFLPREGDPAGATVVGLAGPPCRR